MATLHYQPVDFSKRFHEAVIKSDLSIVDLSKRSGVSRGSLYRYLYHNAVPDIPILARLCKVLNVSADYLIFGEESKCNT